MTFPLIIAHRGASHAAPENTLPAFNLAWQEGADGIEGDFHLTADGHIVCIHDKDTERVSGEKLIVRDEKLETLHQLEVGAWRGEEFRGTRIPLLEEVLAVVPPRKAFEIEIKTGTEMVTPLAAMLESVSGIKITIISFNAEVIAACKRLMPQIPALWLVYFTEETNEQEVLNTLMACNADGLGSSWHISRQLVKELQARDYRWHAWTVNDPAISRKLWGWGVRSITTDTPKALREAMEG